MDKTRKTGILVAAKGTETKNAFIISFYVVCSLVGIYPYCEISSGKLSFRRRLKNSTQKIYEEVGCLQCKDAKIFLSQR